MHPACKAGQQDGAHTFVTTANTMFCRMVVAEARASISAAGTARTSFVNKATAGQHRQAGRGCRADHSSADDQARADRTHSQPQVEELAWSFAKWECAKWEWAKWEWAKWECAKWEWAKWAHLWASH